MKAAIMEEIEANDIEIYQFPDCDSDEVGSSKEFLNVISSLFHHCKVFSNIF